VTAPGRRAKPTALLIDLDGVLREYRRERPGPLEAAAGFAPGEILEVALAPERLTPAMLGQISRAGWRESIAAALVERVGDLEGAERVVEEWDAYRGEIVPEVLAFLADVRAAGIPIALCTNATDDVRADLERFGLGDAFDAVLSSAELGLAKPHPEFYAQACAAVDTPPRDCLFVDDQIRNVAGARAAGLLAYRFSGLDDLAYLRRAFALPR
jgi:putative hydrolase of the HAD superfamily